MPKLKPIQVEIRVQDIRNAMKQWSDMSKEKFNEYLSIPDCVIERCATSIYHQLEHKNSIEKITNDKPQEKRVLVLSETATVTLTNKDTGNIEFEGEVLTSEIQIMPPERQDYTEINFKNGSKLIQPLRVENILRGISSKNIILFEED